MVIAHHLIFTTYGFWLPNDPRGSWSDVVRTWELHWYGGPTKVNHARSVAHVQHDQELQMLQKSALKYPPVKFNADQLTSVAKGFETAVTESDYRVRAASILPDHIHMVIHRHRTPAEHMIGHLKTRATQALSRESIHPLQHQLDSKRRHPLLVGPARLESFSRLSRRHQTQYRIRRNQPAQERSPQAIVELGPT